MKKATQLSAKESWREHYLCKFDNKETSWYETQMNQI